MTRVLHVSDLHFGKPAVPEQIEAIEAVIQQEKFDVVAISGDLSQRARSGEFQRARAFIRHAEQVSKTIVVPGNHDVKWWRAPFEIGNHKRLYANYRQYIDEELEPVLRIPGATFAGLLTAHGVSRHTLTWNVRDIGVIGALHKAQIEHAAREFETSPPDDWRVIVMHHNPVKGELSQRHGLRNTPRILGAFADIGVHAVLCGHDHQEAVHYIEHTKRGIVISTAGTVSNRSRGGRPSSINVLELQARKIHVATLIWSRDASGFKPGPERTFAA
jgi:3',5'-cyclic AMP phosphodiesterase CpdA